MHKQDYYTTYLMEELRNLRLQAGVSLEAIAQQLGVSEKKVSSWEHSPLPDITAGQLVGYAQVCRYTLLDVDFVLAIALRNL